MEREFFDLFDKHWDVLQLDVSYMRSSDWTVSVFDRRGFRGDESRRIVLHQGPDRALVFAKAYSSLAEWYCIAFGGY